MDYREYNARRARPRASPNFEVLPFPGPEETLVTEEPADAISMRRFLSARDRARLEAAAASDEEPLAEFLQQIL